VTDNARLLLPRQLRGSDPQAEERKRRKRRRQHLKWEKRCWSTWSKWARERPCTRCGHCCRNIQFPPFKLTLPEVENMSPSRRPPDEAIAEIRREMERLGHRSDEYDLYQLSRPSPCLWFERGTRRCRWYQWRPLLCRKFACPPKADGTNR
jgi:hypothetical protein